MDCMVQLNDTLVPLSVVTFSGPVVIVGGAKVMNN